MKRTMDDIMGATSDDTRRSIMKLLLKESMSVGDIVKWFTLSQPTISRHLQVLRVFGIVDTSRHGQCILYRLTPFGQKLTEQISQIESIVTQS